MNEQDMQRQVMQRVLEQMEEEKQKRQQEVEDGFNFDKEIGQFVKKQFEKMSSMPGMESIAEDVLEKINDGDREEMERIIRAIKTRYSYLYEKRENEKDRRYLIKLKLIEKELKNRLGE